MVYAPYYCILKTEVRVKCCVFVKGVVTRQERSRKSQVCAGVRFQSWTKQTLLCLSPCLERSPEVLHRWEHHGNKDCQGRHSSAGCVVDWNFTRTLLEARRSLSCGSVGHFDLRATGWSRRDCLLSPLSRRKGNVFTRASVGRNGKETVELTHTSPNSLQNIFQL